MGCYCLYSPCLRLKHLKVRSIRRFDSNPFSDILLSVREQNQPSVFSFAVVFVIIVVLVAVVVAFDLQLVKMFCKYFCWILPATKKRSLNIYLVFNRQLLKTAQY